MGEGVEGGVAFGCEGGFEVLEEGGVGGVGGGGEGCEGAGGGGGEEGGFFVGG